MVSKQGLRAKKLNTLIRDTVDIDSTILITDQYRGYCHVSEFMEHRTVNHSVWYVAADGSHTNNIESFWALLKRGIVGQFHKVSRCYLPACIDEFAYRFNNRQTTDLFSLTVARGLGVA